MTVDDIIEILDGEYGRPRWQTRGDPLSNLIVTILSQNTSDTNSGRSFQNLTGKFSDWEQVADADVEEIAAAIESGGLSRVKAPRIKAILEPFRTNPCNPVGTPMRTICRTTVQSIRSR